MKTNSLFKRLVSMLIVVLMICTLFPVTALAEQGQPSAPGFGELFKLLKVEIECETENNGHDDDEDYDLIDGSYDVSTPTKENDQWKCTVTVYSAKYIEKYSQEVKDNGEKFGPHSPEKNKDKSKTVTLKYKNDKWQLDDKDGKYKIEFDVVCLNAPSENDLGILLLDNAVTIHCTSDSSHTDVNYLLATGTYTPGSVQGDAVNGYTCDITVDPTTYIAEYNKTFKGHTLDPEVQSPKIILEYVVASGWQVKEGNASVTFNVKCEDTPTKPEKPDNNTVEGLANAVKVDCTTEESHSDKTYALIPSTYSIGDVSGNAANGYTCAITVTDPTPYVNKYITDMSGVNHTLDPNTQTPATITLKHNGNSWQIDGEPATFTVKCVTPDPINWETGLSVQKVATNTTSGTVVNTVAPGEKITYTITVENKTGTALTNIKVSEPLDLINLDCLEVSPAGQYSMEYGVGVWTIPSLENGAKTTLTIKVQVKDKVPDKTEIKNIATIIAATAGNDSLPGGIRPTGSSDVKVSAPEEPKVPDAPSYDELKGLLNVTINCINNISHDHKTKTYPLLEGSYMISGVEGDAYTYIVTVDSAEYIAQYTTDTAKKHSLADAQGSKTINLKYSNNRWNVDVPAELAAGDDAEKVSAFPVTFNVVCEETPVTTYTVTYKDGVGGKVFKDDVHTVESGATTPAFVGGIPTRPGYVFVGWTPAVSRCVTGNATYTATWRKVKDTTVIEIGGGNSSSSSSKEENPNTGAPVFVGVSVGALAAAK